MDIHKQADLVMRGIRETGAPDFYPQANDPKAQYGAGLSYQASCIRGTVQAILRSPGCPSLFYKMEGKPLSGQPDTLVQVVDLEGVLNAAVALEAKLSHIVAEA